MEKKWYAVHTYSGYEEKVKIAIEDKIKKHGLQDKISNILLPSEKVVQLKKGTKKEGNKKFYPGYILVEMELDDTSWHLIKNIPRVTGFIGGTKPVALPDDEIEMIIKQQEKGPVKEVKTHYEKGDSVKIIDGPFSNFNGYVDEIDLDHGRLKVMVSIFGRQTPVELDFYQVEKN